MFGFEPLLIVAIGALALAAAAGVVTAFRRRNHRDASLDWDVGGDIV